MVKKTLASFCLLSLLVASCSKDNDNPQPAQEQETAGQATVTATTETADQAAVTTTEVGPADLLIENMKPHKGSFDLEQRHFQRNLFDDSKLAPGGYGTGVLGRPLYMPVNPNGDKRGDFESPDELDCTMPDEIVGQQQYIHGRQMLITDQHGPGNFDAPLPAGYPKTVAGAAVAAANAVSGAMPFSDELSIDYQRKYVDAPGINRMVNLGARTAFPAPLPQSVAAGVKATSCGGEVVVVKTALILPSGGFVVFRTPMVWKNGEWVVVMSKTDEDQLFQPDISSLAGYTKVVLK
ncbi:hypothetical protein ACFSSC_09720 [Corynebacterium mendelii]|uniref:DUF8175 domain-containing protein n=1 Tax=Corynebacterium mendelii TaxID=2765362 RepID=A0A939E3U6_9CORY|nr:hypothetical protein [Corynebacterium mendelii]MBN9645258.1 hypothetical protein [Corynebacterium mendelii]